MEKVESWVLIDKVDPETGEVSRPVVRRVVKRDGKHSFVQSERIICDSLQDFRRAYPRTPVQGAPTQDEVSLLVADMTEEQLEAIGLSRKGATGLDPEWFASPDALALAQMEGLTRDDVWPHVGQGKGRRGLLNTQDVRDILDTEE